MKRYLLALLNLFICGIIIVLLLFPISEVLMPKRIIGDDDMQKLITKGFYNERRNSIDVMFFGDSDVYRAVSPIVLWDNYGISSYVYASPGQRSNISYYFLKDALNYQKPKTVLLNVDTLFARDKHASGSSAKAFDDMEDLKIKTEVIFNKDIDAPIVEKISYIFKVFRYHDRYRELTKDDFKYAYKNIHYPYKGFNISTIYESNYDNELKYMNNKKINEFNPIYKKYLDKIVSLCKEKNIELILMELPSMDSWTYERSKVIEKYAKENNLQFIEMNKKDVNIDWTRDSKDKGNHLNIYGATKVSKYLGKVLSKDKNYVNHKEDKKYLSWEKDSRIYHNEVDKYLNEYENLNKKKK